MSRLVNEPLAGCQVQEKFKFLKGITWVVPLAYLSVFIPPITGLFLFIPAEWNALSENVSIALMKVSVFMAL